MSHFRSNEFKHQKLIETIKFCETILKVIIKSKIYDMTLVTDEKRQLILYMGVFWVGIVL